mmetsp:Transcript_10734/g.30292  ORF Transcript_10734/g.30292 Transcript_10734/m.30292 type:complete len:375 (-) Transcript_10734:30-1154(-)
MPAAEERGRVDLDEVVQVDSHSFLLGRERPPPEDEGAIFGRRDGDAEKLFPRYTHAAAATTGEVEVNGKVLKIWTYQQLEALNQKVLKDRALAIRDAIGEGRCPPIPSIQAQDLIRWILHMQSELTERKPPVGRMAAGGYGNGTGHVVPPSFAQDTKDRPITEDRQPGRRVEHAPFGPRSFHGQEVGKDRYVDLKLQRNDFAEAPNLGIQSGRPGGEGRRHLPTPHNMASCGVSTAPPKVGEGRRYLSCDDHLMEQKHGVEAPHAPRLEVPGSPRASAEPVRHVSESHMSGPGVSSPPSEQHVTGQRRRHIATPDRMVNQGTSAPEEADAARGAGRKYLDSFAGSRSRYGDSHDTYQSTWKKDPSRLLGTSLLV